MGWWLILVYKKVNFITIKDKQIDFQRNFFSYFSRQQCYTKSDTDTGFKKEKEAEKKQPETCNIKLNVDVSVLVYTCTGQQTCCFSSLQYPLSIIHSASWLINNADERCLAQLSACRKTRFQCHIKIFLGLLKI